MKYIRTFIITLLIVTTLTGCSECNTQNTTENQVIAAPQITPSTCMPEMCNSIDDDCDGVVDNGLGVDEPCQDACANIGTNVCGDDLNVVCSPFQSDASQEVCDDGVDNDCDGFTDEECFCEACAGDVP